MNLNIYILDIDPRAAAQALSDHHVTRAGPMALAVLATAHAMRIGKSLKGLDGPRHPLTRYAARSPDFVRWVGAYGSAAAREAWWRGLAPAGTGKTATDIETLAEWLDSDTDPVDVVAKRPLVFVANGGTDVDAGIAGAPQRLDGRPDLAQPGDPVAAYRRWYVATKLGGGPGTWDGQASGWSRRAPPPWLDRCAPAGHEVRIDVLGPTGLIEGEPQHDTHVASLVRSAATTSTKVLDSASRTQ